ncbi:MAG: methionine adenosyltransferase domain-containing protein [Proteobacteria bacterium]|nr:methionine adenosyltransferase domain-containing protein [Pseudomonadota bacterium]
MSYIQTSEYISVGHPDFLADNIAAKLINEIYKQDGRAAHAAIECFIAGGQTTHPVIHVGGEATTTIDLHSDQVTEWIRESVRKCGYDAKNQNKFGRDHVLTDTDYEVQVSVNRQSPDIAKGVGYDKGWNDQGIYFGYADNSNSTKLGLAHAISKFIATKLFDHHKTHPSYGPDIKTLVSVKYKNEATPLYITDITVAQSHAPGISINDVRKEIKEKVSEWLNASEFAKYAAHSIKWVINGTGRFVGHGSLSDSGMTGRKIIATGGGSGGYAPHGGGSATKPHFASDKLLPLFARFLAGIIVDAGLSDTCTISLSGAIGQKNLQSIRIQGNRLRAGTIAKIKKFIAMEFPVISPKSINDLFKTFELNNFDQVIFDGLIGGNPHVQPWEDTKTYAKKLQTAVSK